MILCLVCLWWGNERSCETCTTMGGEDHWHERKLVRAERVHQRANDVAIILLVPVKYVQPAEQTR